MLQELLFEGDDAGLDRIELGLYDQGERSPLLLPRPARLAAVGAVPDVVNPRVPPSGATP